MPQTITSGLSCRCKFIGYFWDDIVVEMCNNVVGHKIGKDKEEEVCIKV